MHTRFIRTAVMGGLLALGGPMQYAVLTACISLILAVAITAGMRPMTIEIADRMRCPPRISPNTPISTATRANTAPRKNSAMKMPVLPPVPSSAAETMLPSWV